MTSSCSFVFFVASCAFLVFSIGFTCGRIYQDYRSSKPIKEALTEERIKDMINASISKALSDSRMAGK